MLITVVELPGYIKKAEHLLSKTENDDLIAWLASNPEAGTILQGAGGVRKIRWKRQGKGKSGGVRAVYYFYNETIPLFMLTLFGKNEKDNLSKSERNQLARVTKQLTIHYGKRNERSV